MEILNIFSLMKRPFLRIIQRKVNVRRTSPVLWKEYQWVIYRQTSNVRRIKSQNLNVSRLVFFVQFIEARCYVENDVALIQLPVHVSDQQLYCLLRRDLYWMFYGNWGKQNEWNNGRWTILETSPRCTEDSQEIPYIPVDRKQTRLL